jgi:conjugative relaxase-like TrwC/TraI family protein
MWLMAAGVKKLTIGGEHTAEQAVGYLADPQARGDYYSEGGAALMFWLATPRSRTYFGLGEWVSRAKLTALLNGLHPVDGQLIRRPGPDGTMVGGIDVTVSPAPKSVSALWALADDDLRRELETLVILAVHRAVGRMLAEVPLVRERYGPGPRDVRHVTAPDWVGVEVLHTTARLSEHKGVPDPQLHVHNVLIGALDYAGRLRALDSRQILLYRSELDAEASSALAEEVRQRGFTIHRELVRGPSGAVKRVAWEIEGVPEDLLRAMSSRRREVEDLRKQYLEKTGREAEGTGWERFLEQHRGPKAKLTADEIREAWEVEGQSYGFGPADAVMLHTGAQEAQRAGIEERGKEGWAAEQLRREILADLCREHALVPERDLDKLLVQRSIGLMDPYTAMGVVAKMFGAGDLLATTDGRVTTLEVLAAEQRATAAAEELLAAPPEPPVDRKELNRDFKAAEDSGRPFDVLQRQAVELATSGARFVSITGPAGTGKGYASRAMVTAWRRQGRRVVALAVTGRTAQQAQADSGADVAYTIDGPLGFKPAALFHHPSLGIQVHLPSALPSPRATPVAEPTPPGDPVPVGTPAFQAGFNVLLAHADPASHLKANRLMARLAGLGVNSVAFAYPVYQDNRFASAVHAGPDTPSDAELADLADLAHAYRMAVVIRPLLDESAFGTGNWRGNIAPQNVAAWFASYTALLVNLGQLAQQHGVEIVVLGGEFDSMQSYTPQWMALIQAVRRVYRGKLTYASNVTTDPALQLGRVKFWSALDFVGADLYLASSAPAGTTADVIVQSWQPLLTQFLAASGATKRPTLVTEIGVRAQRLAHQRPWVWDNGQPEDQAVQESYYLAVCSAIAGHVQGMYWWQTGLDGPNDPSGFNPLGRLAEQQVRACFKARGSTG